MKQSSKATIISVSVTLSLVESSAKKGFSKVASLE
jgi:hypothetical protein